MKPPTFLIVCLTCACATAQEFPKGWKPSSPDQYMKEDLEWYKGVPPNRIIADFNNDGADDIAWLLTNTERSKTALFVLLSGKTPEKQIFKLDEQPLGNYVNVGISLAGPGKYTTACGKGYWECGDDEQATLTLEAPGIDYFVFESSTSVFYWSEKETKFNQMWLSD